MRQTPLKKALLKLYIADPRSKSRKTLGFQLLEGTGCLEDPYLPRLTAYTTDILRSAEGEPLTRTIGKLGQQLRDVGNELPIDFQAYDDHDLFQCAVHLMESAWHAQAWEDYQVKGQHFITTANSSILTELTKTYTDKTTSTKRFPRWDSYFCSESSRRLVSNMTMPEYSLLENMDRNPIWLQAIHRLEGTAFNINSEMLQIARAVAAQITHKGTSDKAIKSREERQEKTLRDSELLLGEPFYRRITTDYRGRLNDAASRVAHSGDDLQRGLVEFAQSAETNPEATEYLWLHTANMLGLKGSVETRVSEAKTYRTTLKEWAANPVDTFTQWGVYKNRFQLIRCALEFKYLSSTNTTRLPIQIDQNASAYQHLALLYRNKDLARLSNLTDEYVHIYAEIARAIEIQDAPPISDLTKIVKSVCMPRIYGGRPRSAQKKLRALVDEVPYLQTLMMEALESDHMTQFKSMRKVMLKGTKTIKEFELDPYAAFDWYADYSHVDPDTLIETPNAYRPRSNQEIFSESSRLAFSGLISAVITALQKVVPDETAYRGTVSKAATKGISRSSDSSATWISPSGFKVHTKKFKEEKNRGIIRKHPKVEGGRPERLSFVLLTRTDQTNSTKTANATVPGLIHSLDAAVLHKTAVAFDMELPLTCNHDSFSTLAPFVAELQHTLRDSLVWTHRSDQLEKITRAFGVPETVAGLHTPDELVLTTTNSFN